MEEIHIIFAKEVCEEELTKTIDLIHQLGFYVEVEFVYGILYSANTDYIVRAISKGD